MRIATTNLEERLVEEIKSGKDVPIERALLIISGLTDEAQIKDYVSKIAALQRGFEEWYAMHSAGKPKVGYAKTARALFDFLWQDKPERYNSRFLLTEVVDNQLSENVYQKVGSCVGLTSLYSILGLKNGLDLWVLDTGDHVISVLNRDRRVYIDNTIKSGFDSFLPRYTHFKKKDLSRLITIVFNERGNSKYDSGDFKGAISDFEKSVGLNPNYSPAFNNLGNAKAALGDIEGAIKDYDKAIKLNPKDAFMLVNRGNAKYELGDLKLAIKDYDKAIELKPDFARAFYYRGIIEEDLGLLTDAIKDYDKAIRLNKKNGSKLDLADCFYHRSSARQELGDLKGAKRDFAQYRRLAGLK